MNTILRYRTAAPKIHALVLTLVLVLGAARPGLATGWEPDGLVLSGSQRTFYSAPVAGREDGSAYVAWTAETDGSYEVRLQLIDRNGDALWGDDGIGVHADTLEQTAAAIANAADGGCYVVWRAGFTPDALLAQHFSAEGLASWPDGPVVVSDASGYLSDAIVHPDTAGGVIVVWRDNRSGYDEIYGQRIGPGGAARWLADGRPLCTALGDKSELQAIPDGEGGLYFAWRDERDGEDNVYAQRVSAAGFPQWTYNGQLIAGTDDYDIAPKLVLTEDGNLGVGWANWNFTTGSLPRAQLLDPDGTELWPAGGIDLTSNRDNNPAPRVVADGEGGLIALWSDYRDTGEAVYAQRVDASGARLWGEEGRAVCSAADVPRNIVACPDGEGGVYAAWVDRRSGSGSEDIYALRFDRDGHPLWDSEGVRISSVADEQDDAEMALAGGAPIITWRDQDGDYRAWVQRLDPFSGSWGRPAPEFARVADVPDDQGGAVLLEWMPGDRDEAWLAEVTTYSVWRATTVMAAKSGPAAASFGAAIGKSSVPFVKSGGYYWEYLADVPALRRDGYSYTAATRNDSLDGRPNRHYFQVVAHSADAAVFWPSAVDSGSSVDNLAPSAPTGLSVSYGPTTELSWESVEDPDALAYRIYRADGPGSKSLQPVAETTDTTWSDGDGWGYSYAVAAVDDAGNESALATPEAASDVPRGGDLRRVALRQNIPNPFNPRTKVGFALPHETEVRLTIIDAAGRVVRRLLAGERRAAGEHAVTWDGRDDRGRSAAAGVYFYRLEAGSDVQSRRMLLLK